MSNYPINLVNMKVLVTNSDVSQDMNTTLAGNLLMLD